VNEWVCERCKSINRERSVTCYSCGASRGAVQVEPASQAAFGAGPGPAPAGAEGAPESVGFAAAPMPAAPSDLPAGPGNLLGGVIGGVVAAIFAAGVWYGVVTITEYQVGFVAIAIGWIVGQGVVLGARGRGSILLIPVSVILTLLALATSEYLIVHHFVSEEFTGVPFPDLELAVDFVTASLQDDPLTLVFWGIALIPAVSVPWGLVSRSPG
jgi:hypothetical protein